MNKKFHELNIGDMVICRADSLCSNLKGSLNKVYPAGKQFKVIILNRLSYGCITLVDDVGDKLELFELDYINYFTPNNPCSK